MVANLLKYLRRELPCIEFSIWTFPSRALDTLLPKVVRVPHGICLPYAEFQTGGQQRHDVPWQHGDTPATVPLNPFAASLPRTAVSPIPAITGTTACPPCGIQAKRDLKRTPGLRHEVKGGHRLPPAITTKLRRQVDPPQFRAVLANQECPQPHSRLNRTIVACAF